MTKQNIVNGELVDMTPEEEAAFDADVAAMMAEPAPFPNQISDRQFFEALTIMSMITEAEALAAVTVGELPTAFETFIAALPSEEQFGARMRLKGATAFQRSHPLTAAFGTMNGMTPQQVDDLWRLAASLN